MAKTLATKSASRLTGKERTTLLALAASYAVRPDVPLKTLLQEARDLGKVAGKDVARLVAGTDLPKGFGLELERRGSLAERAGEDWDDERARRASTTIKHLRDASEKAKRSAFAALRYFLRSDPEVQARLDEIAEGSGDADLVDDCRRLGNLVDQNAAALKKAKLGAKPGDALRTVARALGAAAAEQAATVEESAAFDLRNRAFWHLRAWLDDVRAAGRYVFRAEPRRLAHYRATGTYARQRSRTSKGPSKAVPVAVPAKA